MRVPRPISVIAGILTAALGCAFVLIPLIAVFMRAGGAAHALWDLEILHAAWATAKQAWISTVLSAGLGLPLGLAAARVSRVSHHWGRAIDACLLLPAGVPTVVAATAWVAWLGRSGILAHWGFKLEIAYSLRAVVLAHVFYNAPWIALLVAQARRQVPEAPTDAARTLGAGSFAVFRWVTWPQIRAAFFAAAAQTLALCSMSFALVLILGGGPPVETLETALYSRVRQGSLDLSGAAACAVWELLLTLPPWILVLSLERKSRMRAELLVNGLDTRVADKGGKGGNGGKVLAGIVSIIALFFLVPYSAVFFNERGSGGEESVLFQLGQPEFWKEAWAPLLLSLKIAALTSVSSILVAASATLAMASLPAASRLRTWVEAALLVPSGVSVLALGLGTWIAYSGWIDPFAGSLAAIIALQATLFFPVAFRMLWATAKLSNRVRLEAAITLGASPWQAFWLVDWPRWRPVVRNALGWVAAAALGEVAAVSLFYSESLIPLPLLASRWMGQYRFDEARAASALLLLMAGAIGGMTLLGSLRPARTSVRLGHARKIG